MPPLPWSRDGGGQLEVRDPKSSPESLRGHTDTREGLSPGTAGAQGSRVNPRISLRPGPLPFFEDIIRRLPPLRKPETRGETRVPTHSLTWDFPF